MTQDEFVKIINAHLTDLNKDRKDQVDMFLVLQDDNGIDFYGQGCARCIIDTLIEHKHNFQHQDKLKN